MNKVEIFKNMWVEKHRPLDIDSLILSGPIRDDILQFTSTGSIPHLLFYGQPGGGKTTLAKIIVNSLLECQYLYINASDESGVDTVRGKIKDFAVTKSIDGKLKVVILDEIDGSKADGNGTTMQKALRNVMETYAGNVRFILTCNNIGQVGDAILSRCTIYNIMPDMRDYIYAVYGVVVAEGITLPPKDSPEFAEFFTDIQSRYPDIRGCINHMQRACASGEYRKVSGNTEAMKGVCDSIVEYISNKDATGLRTFVISQSEVISNDYRTLMHIMFNRYFELDNVATVKQRDAMLCIAEHLKSHEVVMDVEINFFAMCLHLMRMV